MAAEKYNGWTNYETWACALWLDQDNDYYLELATEQYKHASADQTFTRLQRATLDLADALKADHEERAQEWMGDQASIFADLLNAGLSDINWYEIARHMLEDNEITRQDDDCEVQP